MCDLFIIYQVLSPCDQDFKRTKWNLLQILFLKQTNQSSNVRVSCSPKSVKRFFRNFVFIFWNEQAMEWRAAEKSGNERIQDYIFFVNEIVNY